MNVSRGRVYAKVLGGKRKAKRTIWFLDYSVDGRRIRKATRAGSKTEAEALLRATTADIVRMRAGLPPLREERLRDATEDYIKIKKAQGRRSLADISISIGHVRDGLYAFLSFRDLPISKVPAPVADDNPAVEVQHHNGRPPQHPLGRLLNGETFPLPADEVAVEDRPGRLQAEDLFKLERLWQLPVKIFWPSRLMLELGVEPGEIALQEAVRIFQS